MTFLLVFLAFALGAALASALHSESAARRARRETEAARARENVAHNRLIGAWKTGYAVPPAEAAPTALAPEEQTTPLLPMLQDLVDDWDAPGARAAQLEVIRQRLREGKSQLEVYNELVPVTAIVPEMAVEGVEGVPTA